MNPSDNGHRELAGCMTALVTPFENGQVDWPRVRSLADRQIDAGVDWVVACSTTGETPTLTADERLQMVESLAEQTSDRCGLMVGTGTNCTATTVETTRNAVERGADAVMLVAPYYNRPTPEGLFRHFATVADSVSIPIMLYNVPARTAVEIPNDVVVRLRRSFPHVVAIKHATGKTDGATELLQECDISVLSGDDSITWPLLAIGAAGVVSVISNLVPELVKSLITASVKKDFDSCLVYHQAVHNLAEGIGQFGPNPIPIKTAMAALGLLKEEFRLPLARLEPTLLGELIEVLAKNKIGG